MTGSTNNLRADIAARASKELSELDAARAGLAEKYIILRKESDGYSTRGPLTWAMPFEKARAEIIRLKTQYPRVNFILAAEVGEAVMTESIDFRASEPEDETAPGQHYPARKEAVSIPRTTYLQLSRG